MNAARHDDLALDSLRYWADRGRTMTPIDLAPTAHRRLLRAGKVIPCLDKAGQRCVMLAGDEGGRDG